MDFSQCLSGCCFNSTCHSLDKCFGVPITVAAVLGTASSKTARQTASACAVNKPPGPACACWRDETAVIVDGLACACDQVRACGICIPASAHGIDIAAFIRDNPQYCAQPAFRTDFAQALGTYYDAEFAKPNGNVNDTSELWTGPTTTKTPMNTTTKAALQKTLSNLIQDMDGNIPAVWVGIWDPAKGWAIVSDGLAWTKANATNMTEATNATNATTVDHSRIGSCTKTFVATEILKLVDVGRIKLTDTVSVLLPHVAKAHSYTADVTLGELIGMRSGFPDYAAVDPIINDAWNNPSKIYTADELIRAGLANATARGDATYSNTNYIMLGEIARNLTGQTIFDLVTRNVRVKGLTDTALPKPGDRAMPAPFSRGYNYAFGQFSLAIQGLEVELGSEQQDDVTSWGQAAGAMYSTVADLGKWAGTALGTAELSKATAAARLAFRPINGGSIMYGLGMESFGSGWIGHDGQAIGWETRTAYNTETGGAAVIIVNESGSLSFAVKAMKEWLPGMIV
ncbi:beta-lactamase/transpeptidase-like protein [Hyaloraphidium curvatum]|nr:beta-lactamase/transpeptidase-like protein [Hyaloraphidium curvatum]